MIQIKIWTIYIKNVSITKIHLAIIVVNHKKKYQKN